MKRRRDASSPANTGVGASNPPAPSPPRGKPLLTAFTLLLLGGAAFALTYPLLSLARTWPGSGGQGMVLVPGG